MTAEQLEELLADLEHNSKFRRDAARDDLAAIAPSLARRVIAAEKLEEVAGRAVKNYYSHPSSYIEGMRDMDDAIVAYREASK